MAQGMAAATQGVDNANKYTKAEANYRNAGSSVTNCGACRFYQGSGICSQDEGAISTGAVCDLFQARGAGLQDLIR